MKYLFKVLLVFFSVGILLYPAGNYNAQNASIDMCCSSNKDCHDTTSDNNHQNSKSQDCCQVPVSVVQYITTENRIPVNNIQNKNFKLSSTFFYSNTVALNTLLENVFQPPKV